MSQTGCEGGGAGADPTARQRAALAEFGAGALAGTDLDQLLTEGARLCAEGLGVPFCKVLEYRPGTGDLVVRAGVGWKAGVVGRAVARADAGNPGGRAFAAAEPVVFADLRGADRLDLPPLYPDHGIVSTANVPIAAGSGGEGELPFGVLEVDAPEPRRFGERDLDFLRRYAGVMAAAVRAQRRRAAARAELAALRAECDARLALLREQQHRVRNDLTALAATLQGIEGRAADAGTRARVGGALRQVFALAALYDHLLGAGIEGGEASLRDYLAALCDRAREFHGLAARGVALAFEAPGAGPVPMGVAACTALGVAVNELIANAAEHAFGPAAGGGGGRIEVALRPGEGGGALLTVADDGRGVAPGAVDGGLGLGFARRLVGRLGASLTLRSAPDHGAVWTIALPG